MFLIVDTETNGLGGGSGSTASGYRGKPRMVELAYLLVGGDGHPMSIGSSLIIPDGFSILRSAQAVHGISLQEAAMHGVPVEEAITALCAAARRSDAIVAHNAWFDLGVIAGEAERYDLPCREIFRPWYCTMRGGAPLCSDGKTSRGTWPTLERLHTALFGTGLQARHRAFPDAEACAKCFLEMRRLKRLDRRGLIWHHRSGSTFRQ